MKIVVMGAGSVGGYIGGRLAKSGEDVTLIARGKHLQSIREQGLKIKSINGDFEVKVNATDNTKEVGKADLILFTVKSYDTLTAIEQCRPIIKESTIVMSLQNGVDNDEKIGKILGKEKVIPAMIAVGCRIISPGVIEHTVPELMTFGEENGKLSERIKQTSQIFQKAKINHRVSDNVIHDKWFKFMWNVAYNQITAITRKTCGEVINCEETKKLAELALQEVVAVANKKNINLEKTDVKKILDLSPNWVNFRTSMLQDVEAGKNLEVDAFSGVIVKYGKELGVPTPYNHTLYCLLKLISKNGGKK